MIQVTIAFFLCYLFSVISVGISIFTLHLLIIESVSSAIWAGLLGINLTFYTLVFLITLILPFPLFVITAFYLKPTIYATPYSENAHFGIFIFFAGFPFIVLMLFICLLIIRHLMLRKFAEKLSRLIETDPQIEILNCRAFNQPKRGGIIELTVSLKKVLPIFSYYYLEARIQEDQKFSKEWDRKGNIGNLKVTRQNESWIFQDVFTEDIISNDPNQVTFQIRFVRISKTTIEEFPTKILFLLSIHNPIKNYSEHFYKKVFDIEEEILI